MKEEKGGMRRIWKSFFFEQTGSGKVRMQKQIEWGSPYLAN
jgi:hypothetical protein